MDCSPSLFIPALIHLFRRHALHWFLWVLSTGHLFWVLDLHTYCLFLLMDLCKINIIFMSIICFTYFINKSNCIGEKSKLMGFFAIFAFRLCVLFFFLNFGRNTVLKKKWSTLKNPAQLKKMVTLLLIIMIKNYKIFNMFSEVNITYMTCYAMQGRISLGRGVNCHVLYQLWNRYQRLTRHRRRFHSVCPMNDRDKLCKERQSEYDL